MPKSSSAKLVAALAAISLLASGGASEANPLTRFFAAFRHPHHRHATPRRPARIDEAAANPRPRSTSARPIAMPDNPAAASARPQAAVLSPARGEGGGKLLRGVLVPDKPGFVRSPYTQNQAVIDVRGFPSGTKVTDPSTGKVFLAP